MNLYDATVPVFTKLLRNIDRWFDKAVASAEQRKFDPEVFATARLAPNQFALIGQVQGACDTAKYAVAKLTGTEPPSHPDTEKTLADLRARIATCATYLETFKREQFVGAEDRSCTHSWMGGKVLRGGDYLDHYALPNFHFHLVTAYSILRHNGVELGKTDLLAPLPFKD